MIIGSLFTVNQVSGLGAFIITAISLFSGAWMDLQMVGGVFETIGYALPFAHAVDAANGLLKGASFIEIINNFYFILLTTFVLIILAIFSFKWTMKRK
jgi:ABC-2 type transport system permease protein